MSTLTLRISEKLLHELDNSAHIIKVPRAEYVRHAIEEMNKKVLKEELEQKLKAVSLKVRKEGMRVNAEFDKDEYDPKA